MGFLSSVKISFCYIFGVETKEEKQAKEKTSKAEQKPTSDKDKEKKEIKWKDVNDPFKFVIMGAKVQCTFCSPPLADLIVTSTDITMQDKPWATIKDCDGKKNFTFSGICNHPSQKKPGAPPPPCKTVISLGQWKDFSDTMVNDDNALLMKSKIPCMISGQDLIITDCGQKTSVSEVEPKMNKEPKVTNLYWMDEREEEIIDEISPGQTAILFVETEDFRPNQIIKIPIEYGEPKEKSELKGKLDISGKAKIFWTRPIIASTLAQPLIEEQGAAEEVKSQITKVYWTYEDDLMPLREKSRFYIDMNLHIETIGYNQGDELSIVLKSESEIPLTDKEPTIKLIGTVDENGSVIIRDALKNYTLNLTKS